MSIIVLLLFLPSCFLYYTVEVNHKTQKTLIYQVEIDRLTHKCDDLLIVGMKAMLFYEILGTEGNLATNSKLSSDKCMFFIDTL